MNIHEHQAKEILREYGTPVSKGIVIKTKNEIKEKIRIERGVYVLKAQIHAGGRGKAGGVKHRKKRFNFRGGEDVRKDSCNANRFRW